MKSSVASHNHRQKHSKKTTGHLQAHNSIQIVITFLARLGSLLLGAAVFTYGFFIIAIGACHDSGGFCTGELQIGYYFWGVITVGIGALFMTLPFTLRPKRIATSIIVITGTIALFAIYSELAG